MSQFTIYNDNIITNVSSEGGSSSNSTTLDLSLLPIRNSFLTVKMFKRSLGSKRKSLPDLRLRDDNNRKRVRRSKVKIYPIRCEFCPYMAYQESSFKSHSKCHEFIENSHKCNFCSFNSEKKQSITLHEHLHIEKKLD